MKNLSIILFFMVFLIMCLVSRLHAHEVRPGYLDLRQTGTETFNVLWKVPARGDLRLSLNVRFPENCQPVTPRISYQSVDAFTERYTLLCRGGLAERTISIDGLSATLTDVLVRLKRIDETIQIARLTPSSPSFIVEATPDAFRVFVTYLHLGVEHILLGIDHLLFVLALLIIVQGWRRLLGTISTFTIAHSITLAAATLGLVNVPQQPVEAVIALSIVFIAGECVHSRNGRAGITNRRPWVVAFIFGLLHGFGFAGALSEAGLPQKDIPVALLSFNIGVEFGQILFIMGVIILGSIIRRIPVVWPTLGHTDSTVRYRSGRKLLDYPAYCFILVIEMKPVN
jgi:hydrogenase/urease accessory protein HupE